MDLTTTTGTEARDLEGTGRLGDEAGGQGREARDERAATEAVAATTEATPTSAGALAGAVMRTADTSREPGDHSLFRHSYSRDRTTLVRRLRRIEGQVRGIERMIEREEYCIDILQQTAALRAAVDSVALLVLEDHVQGCVRTAAEQGDAERYVEEVLDVVRRTLGKPVRGQRA